MPRAKVMPLNCLFHPSKSPKPKDTEFKVIQNKEKPKILTSYYKLLIIDIVGYFFYQIIDRSANHFRSILNNSTPSITPLTSPLCAVYTVSSALSVPLKQISCHILVTRPS